jgi:hypothetical protein
MKIKNQLWQVGTVIALTTIISFNSCKKENQADSPNDAEAVFKASADDAVMEDHFNSVFDDVAGVDDATAGEDIGLYGSDGFGVFANRVNIGGNVEFTGQNTVRCFTVTIEPRDRGVFPKTVIIDFGTGCTIRGHERKGQIITVYTGRLHIPGNKATTSFENYYIDSFKIEGTHVLENSSSPGSNRRSFTTKIENAKVTNVNSGNWVGWNSEKVFTQVEGNGTPWWPNDDVFHISGSSSGEWSTGKSWRAETTDPLVKKFGCKWIVDGTIRFKVNNTEGILEYGDGTCDNAATVTVNGHTRTIRLR